MTVWNRDKLSADFTAEASDVLGGAPRDLLLVQNLIIDTAEGPQSFRRFSGWRRMVRPMMGSNQVCVGSLGRTRQR